MMGSEESVGESAEPAGVGKSGVTAEGNAGGGYGSDAGDADMVESLNDFEGQIAIQTAINDKMNFEEAIKGL
ncbi:hypothetical protein Nepgr_027852 [Nepenthes gracilis]|uniref:Uncharacterized protein n=1 Tax=Nepenthes gracilis TaxID=150966 RepID=A0AAD3Y3I4_NEPGR|nr:hypothetical protein Nepgr_027852 [Nepenthes gracilis]